MNWIVGKNSRQIFAFKGENMRNRKYIDFKLIEKVPNKYNIKPEDIKKLKVLDWNKLKNIPGITMR